MRAEGKQSVALFDLHWEHVCWAAQVLLLCACPRVARKTVSVVFWGYR